MSQLEIALLTPDQRRSVVARLSEQPLAVLESARRILKFRMADPCDELSKNEQAQIYLLEEAIVAKAFENILDEDCAEEQEKYSNLVRMGSGE